MRRSVFIPALLLAACGGESTESGGAHTTAVVRTLELARESPNGVSPGFNLDGFVSESNDGRSCFQSDFTDPEGVVGIDNQLATLLPLIDLAGEDALEGLIQNAVNEGRLLMFFEVVEGDDGQFTLRVRRGDDVPLLGTDGKILSGQTLALDEAEPILGPSTPATVEGNLIEAGPFEVQIPVIVFSQLYEVRMPAAYARLTIDEETGVARGTVGGGIPMPQLIQILDTAGNFGPEFEELFGDAVRDAADLERDADGNCTQMSAVITFDAVPAFIWE